MYSDMLDTLEHDPLNGMCAPSLMGSSGYIPLSIISLYVTFTNVISMTFYSA
jgi:hypothetical protein